MNRHGKATWRGHKRKNLRTNQLADGVEVQTRSINWKKEESDNLLSAACEVQLQYGRNDLNFTKPEMSEVYAIFRSKPAPPDTSLRTQEHALTRLKTMRKEFNIFRELATKAPSQEILKAHCESEARLKYFDTKKFPWYLEMEAMSGGRLATCEGRTSTCNMGSRTDSSDNPENEEPMPNETYVTIEQSDPLESIPIESDPVGSVPSGGDGTTYSGRSSGSSKRKSRDDGAGGSRKEKIQKRISAKEKGLEKMTDTAEKIIATNEKLVGIAERAINFKESVGTEKKRGIEKLKGFGFSMAIQNAIMKEFNDSVTLTFFLDATSEEIFDWMKETLSVQLLQRHFPQCFGQPSANPQQGDSYFTPNLVNALQYFGFNPRPPCQ